MISPVFGGRTPQPRIHQAHLPRERRVNSVRCLALFTACSSTHAHRTWQRGWASNPPDQRRSQPSRSQVQSLCGRCTARIHLERTTLSVHPRYRSVLRFVANRTAHRTAQAPTSVAHPREHTPSNCNGRSRCLPFCSFQEPTSGIAIEVPPVR